MAREKINWDLLGIFTSIACAIHCAILPLLLSSLPVLGINIIHNPVFETLMILLALLIGSVSLVHGFRKHHGRLLPIIVFSLGMLLLFAKQCWHEYEARLLPIAVAMVIWAHAINLRNSRLRRTAPVTS